MTSNMKRMLLYGGIFSVLLLICSWWFVGRAAQYYLEGWLKRHGAELVSAPTVSWNPLVFSVTIQNARIQKGSHPVSVLEKAVVYFSPWGLLQREIRISEAFVQGIRLVVRKDGTRFYAGGFPLPLCGTEKTSGALPGWPFRRFIVTRTSVLDSKIQLRFPDHDTHIRIDKLLVWDGLLSEQTKQGSFALTGALNGAEVKVESAFGIEAGKGSAVCNIDLKKAALKDFQGIVPDAVSGINGRFSVDSKLNVEMENDRIEISQKGKGSIADFHAVVAPYAVANQAADFRTSLLLTLRKGIVSYAGMTASLNSHAFQVRDTDTDFTMINWENAGAENVELSYQESFLLFVPLFQSSMLTIAVPPTGTNHEKFPLIAAETLSAKNVHITPSDIRIGHLALNNMDGAIVLDPDRMPVNIPEVQVAENEREGQASAEMEIAGDSLSEDRFGIRLDFAEISGDSHFSFIDESVDPIFSESFTIHAAEIKSLNTGNPGQKGQFYLSADAADFGEMDVSGDIRLSGGSLSLQVESTISGYPLPDLSAYARSLLGHDITDGQLNAEASLEIMGAGLCGEVQLMIRDIRISPALPDFSTRITGCSVMPLDAAVNYLTDRDGNLKINVPISEYPDDSGYGLVYFSQVMLPKAIRAAAYGMVKNIMIPYNALIHHAADMEVYDDGGLIQLRLDPVILNAGEILPGKDADEYTRQLSEFLKQEPSLRIMICGFATERDRSVLKSVKTTPLDMNKMLLDLARERAETFREILVSHYDVPSSRIVSCRPMFDPGKDQKPRIEISL